MEAFRALGLPLLPCVHLPHGPDCSLPTAFLTQLFVYSYPLFLSPSLWQIIGTWGQGFTSTSPPGPITELCTMPAYKLLTYSRWSINVDWTELNMQCQFHIIRGLSYAKLLNDRLYPLPVLCLLTFQNAHSTVAWKTHSSASLSLPNRDRIIMLKMIIIWWGGGWQWQ